MKLLSIAAVALMVGLAIFADFLLKVAGQKPSIFNGWFFGGMFVYASTAFVWYFVLKYLKFSEANLLYSLLTVGVSVFLGTVFFKENLTVLEIIAIFMALTSMIILGRFA